MEFVSAFFDDLKKIAGRKASLAPMPLIREVYKCIWDARNVNQ